MAVFVIAVELRVVRPAGSGAGAAVSDVSALVGRLGWLLALVAGATAGRTDLDSAGTLCGVSTLTRAPAGPAVDPTAGCGQRHRLGTGPEGSQRDGLAPGRRATRRAAHDRAYVVAALSRSLADAAGQVHVAGGQSGWHPGGRRPAHRRHACGVGRVAPGLATRASAV